MSATRVPKDLKSTTVNHTSARTWQMLNANIKVVGSVFGLKSDGDYFHDEQTISDTSIDLLSYVNNRTHNHVMGGDTRMKKTDMIRRFFEIPVVEHVYHFIENGKDHLYVVLSDDQDDIAFQLATIKCELRNNDRRFDPEIDYSTRDEFDRTILPSTVNQFSRG